MFTSPYKAVFLFSADNGGFVPPYDAEDEEDTAAYTGYKEDL